MFVRHAALPALCLLLSTLFNIAVVDSAVAQDRWPPWPSYGEAETTRKQPPRRRPATDAASLEQQIARLQAAGKAAQAEPLARRLLALAERKGPDSPEVAKALDTLAGLYETQGKYAAAEPLLKRALSIREKLPGQPDVAPTRARLAVTYDKLGRSADAAALRGTGDQQADAKNQHHNAVRKKATAPRPSFSIRKEEPSGGSGVGPQTAEGQARPDAAMKQTAPPMPSPPPPPAAPPLAGGAPPPAGGSAPPPGMGQAAPPPVANAPAPRPSASARAPDRAVPPRPRLEAAPPPMLPGAPAPADVPDAAPAPAPAPPPAAAADDWQVVPVYWGTDRAIQPNAQRLAFGSDRGRRLQLGEALVTVPKVHEVPNIERPWVITVPYFDVTIYAQKEDPKSHFTIKEIKGLSKEELLAQVRARLAASVAFKDQAFVFVHGYNTSFDNAVYRTAQIAYDLGFDGAPFLYSWPSGGAVASYTYDRESAQGSEPYLREFLQMVVKETGAKQVSVIAHSMGNQPVMDVLRSMHEAAPEGVEISQVILAAPDVDADSFTNLATAIKGLAKNVTLYVASNDRALIVSRNFWGSYRAGDVPPKGPLILDGIDTIDVTAASTDTFAINHSGYASNNKLLEDIAELLKTGLRPPEMRVLKPNKITGGAGDYWRYVPAAN